jgi:hypothetical protein
MLDTTRHVAKNPYHSMYVERDHLKCDFEIVSIQLTVFNKDQVILYYGAGYYGHRLYNLYMNMSIHNS